MKSNAINLDSIVCRSENQVSTEMDGETILMSIEQGNYYGMDSILSRIWSHIEQPLSIAEMRNRLREEYDVDKETCERDVLEILKKLADENLITL